MIARWWKKLFASVVETPTVEVEQFCFHEWKTVRQWACTRDGYGVESFQEQFCSTCNKWRKRKKDGIYGIWKEYEHEW